jgi:uncharacterized RDD family membrane protein YckC
MVSVKLDTGYNIEVEFEVAPFSKRLLAWLIDVMACWMMTKGLAAALKIDSFFVWTDTWDLRGLLVSLPVLFYHLFCELTMNGRSLGKLALRCKVITEDGGQPSIGQYLIRWVFRIIDFPYWILFAAVMGVLPWWTAPLVFAGIASVLISPKSQRLGDIVAGTILINTRNHTSWQDTVFADLSADYKPMYPQVMQLSDRDINTLKSIIETVKRKNDHELARRIAERIQTKVNIQSNQYALDFLESLLLDYNYYSTR